MEGGGGRWIYKFPKKFLRRTLYFSKITLSKLYLQNRLQNHRTLVLKCIFLFQQREGKSYWRLKGHHIMLKCTSKASSKITFNSNRILLNRPRWTKNRQYSVLKNNKKMKALPLNRRAAVLCWRFEILQSPYLGFLLNLQAKFQAHSSIQRENIREINSKK